MTRKEPIPQFRVCMLLFTCTLISYTPAISHKLRFPHRRRTASLLTFNAALADIFVKREERRDALISELEKPGIRSDVVCLQEVFLTEDVRILTEAVKRTYPYSYSAVHSGNQVQSGTVPQCKGPVFEAYKQCVEANCAVFDESTREGLGAAIGCANLICGVVTFPQAGIEEQGCIDCLARFTPVKALERCSSSDPNSLINPPGLLLLSRKKIAQERVVFFPPTNAVRLLRMGYLQVSVKGLGTVVCTHQIANPSPVYLEAATLPFGNYENQNLNETITTLNNLEDKRPLVLIGDINTGPAVESQGVVAVFPASYRELVDSKRRLETKDLSLCTFCSTNTFPGTLSEIQNELVDHIFVRDHKMLSLERVLEDNNAVSTPDLPLPAIPLSDHYGVRAKIRVTRCRRG